MAATRKQAKTAIENFHRMSVEELLTKWPLPDGTTVVVRSTPALWDFLASKRHPKQRSLSEKALLQLKKDFAEGYQQGRGESMVNVLSSKDSPEGFLLNWQHRVELFRRHGDPNTDIVFVFGCALESMVGGAHEVWNKAERATLILGDACGDKGMTQDDMAVANACETIIYGAPSYGGKLDVAMVRRWLPEVIAARGLGESTRTHPRLLSRAVERAAFAMFLNRYGEAKARPVLDQLYNEVDAPGTIEFFNMMARKPPAKMGYAAVRILGPALLRGLQAMLKGRGSTWKLSQDTSRDEKLLLDWRSWAAKRGAAS